MTSTSEASETNSQPLNIELILEAERRGILPPDKATALAEARRRGLLPSSTPAAKSTLKVFEIQSPDGTIYEVEAESAEAAAAAVSGLGGEKKSWHQVLRENIVGDQNPYTQNFGEKVGAALNKAGESLTFGLIGDEASAAVESLVPGVNYEDRRDHYRQQEEVLERDNPVVAIGAELAPLAIPGIGAFGLAGKGAGLARRTAQGATVGGTQAGTYGFMEGEGGADSRFDGAKSDAVLGSILGGAAPAVARTLSNKLDRRATRRAVKRMVNEAPSADDLASEATGFYNQGRARNQVLEPGAAKALSNDVTNTLKREGVMRADGSLITRDPDARRVLEELDDLITYGLSGPEVKPVREVFQAAAKDPSPARSRLGKILLNKFDEAVHQNAPEFREGDALYSRAMRVRDVDQMTDLADTSDSANALRREFQKADRNQIRGRSPTMTDDEVGAMQRVARGSRLENTARALGRSAPTSLGNAIFTGGIPLSTGAMAGSPEIGALVAAGSMGLGTAGKLASNSMQRRNTDIAKALIASGGKMPKAQAPSKLKEEIARILMGAAPRVTAMGN